MSFHRACNDLRRIMRSTEHRINFAIGGSCLGIDFPSFELLTLINRLLHERMCAIALYNSLSLASYHATG